MKKSFKNMIKTASVLAISFATISPSVSFASEAEAQRLLNKLYNQMDEISELTGLEKIDRPEKSSSSKAGKTTTTTTSTSKTSVVNTKGQEDKKQEKKEEEEKEPAYIRELRESYNTNDITVKALEEVLEKYPKTIKGKEEKLVNLLVEAHELKLQAADLINSISDEKISVKTPNIPDRYKHLIRF